MINEAKIHVIEAGSWLQKWYVMKDNDWNFINTNHQNYLPYRLRIIK